jgi:hypothetical protein
MATVNYTNAKILINGALLSANFKEITLTYGAETNDDTTFGDSVRSNKGGLFTTKCTGSGYIEFIASGVEEIIFNAVGVDGTLITLFANGITEGTTTDRGFSMYGVVDEFNIGGEVGTILPFTFSCASRGVTP